MGTLDYLLQGAFLRWYYELFLHRRFGILDTKGQRIRQPQSIFIKALFAKEYTLEELEFEEGGELAFLSLFCEPIAPCDLKIVPIMLSTTSSVWYLE